MLDYVHKDDFDKVKEQISSNQETNTIGRILDLKTGTVKKEGHTNNTIRTHMGSRRAFICRLRIGNHVPQAHQQQHYNQQQAVYNNYPSRTQIHMNALGSNGASNGTDTYDGHNYAVVHVTGYTKSWPSTNNTQIDDANNENNNNNNNKFCLIAIARIQVTNMPIDTINASNLEFVTRTDQDGKITFVDQR